MTLRIDTSSKEAGVEHEHMSLLNLGHAWLSITSPDGHRVDLGYYCPTFWEGNPGAIDIADSTHQAHQDAAYTFAVTAAQADRLFSVAHHIANDPGAYHVLSHNCLTVAHILLTASAIPVPPLPHSDPFYGWSAWKTGVLPPPTPEAHDPAVYNSILEQSPEGRAARALYERSTELHGTDLGGVDAHHVRVEAREQAAAEADDHGPHSTNDVDHHGNAETKLADLVESGDDDGLDPDDAEGEGVADDDGWWNTDSDQNDPGLSTMAAADSSAADPGLSHDPHQGNDPGTSTSAGAAADPGLSHDTHGSAPDPGAYVPHDVPYEPPPLHHG